MLEKLFTQENITAIISVSVFIGLVFMLTIGYFVPMQPVWWNSF
jgi:hypothetical protein